MDEKLSIKVNVADRYYPLKIDRDDEEKIRKAAKLINEKVFLYKQKYADKDTQDFLAMAALQFVIRNLEVEEKPALAPGHEELARLDKELAEYLAKE
jgi:cell division protein ZapA (FtsZ GTPase activity inhibitor)